MKIQSLSLNMLIVALSLGTAWAIRGQFGHEHGAAWAGSIGSLMILLLSKRKDWLAKAFSVTLAGALGWGAGGMMSYGLVVGYGSGADWLNVTYGLVMLFVIGGLYGFLGGGLLGVSLSNTKKNPVKWPKLIVEMIIGGMVFYFFIIEQFGWLMTPPRSEVWAVCLGMAAALAWNLAREKNTVVLRLAIYTGLGGGFGFAFGNFLQVLGTVSELKFNFWNVMEYSLGFFGGLGLSYGTFTGDWEKERNSDSKDKTQMFSLWSIVLIIPFIMWQQNFEWDRIQETFVKLLAKDNAIFYQIIQLGSLGVILMAGIYWVIYFTKQDTLGFREIRIFFFGHWALYIALSFLITGAFLSTYRPEQYLYLVNFIVVMGLISKRQAVFEPRPFQGKTYLKLGSFAVIVLGILAFVLIQTHGEIKGSHKRFGEEVSSMPIDTTK